MTHFNLIYIILSLQQKSRLSTYFSSKWNFQIKEIDFRSYTMHYIDFSINLCYNSIHIPLEQKNVQPF